MAITLRIESTREFEAVLLTAAKRYQSKARTRKLIRPAAMDFRDFTRKEISSTFAGSDRSSGVLAGSIITKIFRKSRSVFVGPRFKGSPTTASTRQSGRSKFGYYFAWQSMGTSRGIRAKNFFDKVVASHGAAVKAKIIKFIKMDLKHLARR